MKWVVDGLKSCLLCWFHQTPQELVIGLTPSSSHHNSLSLHFIYLLIPVNLLHFSINKRLACLRWGNQTQQASSASETTKKVCCGMSWCAVEGWAPAITHNKDNWSQPHSSTIPAKQVVFHYWFIWLHLSVAVEEN